MSEDKMMEGTSLPTEIERLNVQERLQHLFTFLTFVILVVTGYMLRIPEEAILKLGQYGETIFFYRGVIHRVAGVAMILTSVYHLVYLIVSRHGRSFFVDMLPTFKDIKDVIGNIGYYLGMRKSPPLFERFDYREKAEYWALVAGTVIISTTGIFLWSEAYWSKFILDISILIHGMEAILATLAIIVWHFYAVHWKPGQFPMNSAWIDGKMSAHHLKEEHALQYERLVKEGKLAPVEEDSNHSSFLHHPRRKTFGRRFIELTSFASIFFFAIVSYLLVKILYFPTTYNTGEAQAAKSISEFELFMQKPDETETANHFHNIDTTVELEIANKPICLNCHGTYPHGKAPDIRSFLNMHNYFMACETCHVRREDVDGKVQYTWFDNQTEAVVTSIKGNNGVYGARLVPVMSSPSGTQRLDRSSNEQFAKEYMARKDKLTPEEQARAKVVLHKDISKKPLQCTECHSMNAYIDLAAVGYSRTRAESLYRTEVADMINRYLEFYLPTMFDPDLMKKEKLEKLKSANRSTD
ncbi:formate dehydrogenase subunit gamma [Desulfosediminicola flagellatus]|uniref:formate dehydrogenase subunit gamma n=1 Tax=Desulfosediminicola flagellatus TaxID=2569541 RepID=UPI0010AC6E3C|nr:cytochrome b/b6 domain-containing protein [Desulfosediminicola flagellatus]